MPGFYTIFISLYYCQGYTFLKTRYSLFDPRYILSIMLFGGIIITWIITKLSNIPTLNLTSINHTFLSNIINLFILYLSLIIHLYKYFILKSFNVLVGNDKIKVLKNISTLEYIYIYIRIKARTKIVWHSAKYLKN